MRCSTGVRSLSCRRWKCTAWSWTAEYNLTATSCSPSTRLPFQIARAAMPVPSRARRSAAAHLPFEHGDEVLLRFGELRLVAVVHLAEELGALGRAGALGVLDVLVVRHQRLRLVLDQRDPVVREVAERMGVVGTFVHANLRSPRRGRLRLEPAPLHA